MPLLIADILLNIFELLKHYQYLYTEMLGILLFRFKTHQFHLKHGSTMLFVWQDNG